MSILWILVSVVVEYQKCDISTKILHTHSPVVNMFAHSHLSNFCQTANKYCDHTTHTHTHTHTHHTDNTHHHRHSHARTHYTPHTTHHTPHIYISHLFDFVSGYHTPHTHTPHRQYISSQTFTCTHTPPHIPHTNKTRKQVTNYTFVNEPQPIIMINICFIVKYFCRFHSWGNWCLHGWVETAQLDNTTCEWSSCRQQQHRQPITDNVKKSIARYWSPLNNNNEQ